MLLATNAFATAFTAAEYCWDTDPGPGNGTPILLSPAPDSLLYEAASLNTSALSVGAHILYVRDRDSQNRWSRPEGRRVYISVPLGPTVRTVTHAEYFWDTDPGAGNATPFTFTSTASPYLVRGTLASGAPGDHVFKMRYRDNLGFWGSPEGLRVYVVPPHPVSTPTVVQERVYFDSLTAPPTGTYLIPDDGTFNEPEEAGHRLLSSALFSGGQHFVYARVQDSRGFWSAASRDTFVVAPFNFQLTARPNANADSVRLNWARYPVTDHYHVHTDSLVTGPFTSFFTVPGTDTTVVLPTVSPPPTNPKRFYQVNAVLPDTAMFRNGDLLPQQYRAEH